MVGSSAIIEFYLGRLSNDCGEKLADMLMYDYEKLQASNHYIQWLFPVVPQSQINAAYPVLDDEAIAQFRASPTLQKRMLVAFNLMLDFYGLHLICDESCGTIWIERSSGFTERRDSWLNWGNPNHLRITRILTSLNLLGMEEYSAALLACLKRIFKDYPYDISPTTLRFWENTTPFQRPETLENSPAV